MFSVGIPSLRCTILEVLRIAAASRILEELDSCRGVTEVDFEAGEFETEYGHTIYGSRNFDTSAESR